MRKQFFLHLNSNFPMKKCFLYSRNANLCTIHILIFIFSMSTRLKQSQWIIKLFSISFSLNDSLCSQFYCCHCSFRTYRTTKVKWKNGIALQKTKPNEWHCLFRSFNTDFYIFCSLLNANFSVEHFFHTKNLQLLFKVVQVASATACIITPKWKQKRRTS